MIKKPSPLQTEIRSAVTTSRVELRAGADGTMPTLVGYAAVFDSRIDLGWFEEEVAVGAFTRSLTDGDDVRALYNHDSAQVIGRRDAKTLRLEEDATGLRIEIDLPDTTAARDLIANINAGNIDGMSFGFRAREQEWIEREDEPELRRLIDVELIEVSAVTFPAYPDTSIAKRSLELSRTKSPAGQSASDERNEKPTTPSLQVLRLRAARLQ